jgi:membrane protein implicated in regulation of membrane protease activity
MSTAFFLWLIVGSILIVGELMTGSFYLLIFGVAAWFGAAFAYAGYGVDLQLAVAGVMAIVGLAAVHRWGGRWRGSDDAHDAADPDIGNTVRVEQMVSPTRYKVAYRGTQWDAEAEPGVSLHVGQTGTIRAVRGSLLIVEPLK